MCLRERSPCRRIQIGQIGWWKGCELNGIDVVGVLGFISVLATLVVGIVNQFQRAQIRAARALIRWSAEELAKVRDRGFHHPPG